MVMMMVVALKAAILDLTAGTVVKATTTTTTTAAITGNSNNNNENLKPKMSCLRRSRRLRDFYDSSLKHSLILRARSSGNSSRQHENKSLWALDVCSLLFSCGGVDYSLTVVVWLFFDRVFLAHFRFLLFHHRTPSAFTILFFFFRWRFLFDFLRLVCVFFFFLDYWECGGYEIRCWPVLVSGSF